MPLHSGADLQATTKNIKEGKQVMAKSFPSAMRLIIARRASGDTLMFVATLVPTLARSPHPIKSMNNFRYLGGGDFTGKVFCSTLEGQFVEVAQYVNGKRAGMLKATTRAQLESKGVDLNSISYEAITWSPTSVVKQDAQNARALEAEEIPEAEMTACANSILNIRQNPAPIAWKRSLSAAASIVERVWKKEKFAIAVVRIAEATHANVAFTVGIIHVHVKANVIFAIPSHALPVKDVAVISVSAFAKKKQIALMDNAMEIPVLAVQFVKVHAKDTMATILKVHPQLTRIHYMIPIPL